MTSITITEWCKRRATSATAVMLRGEIVSERRATGNATGTEARAGAVPRWHSGLRPCRGSRRSSLLTCGIPVIL